MTNPDLFFTRTGMDRARVQQTVDGALSGSDDGELFLEYCQSESFTFDDGRIKNASFDTSQGFGLRAVSGETTGFAHSSTLNEQALSRAADTVKAVRSGNGGTITNQALWNDSASYEFNNDYGGNISSFVNALSGTYKKTEGNTNVFIPFVNFGTLSVTGGTFNLQNGGTFNDGSIVGSSGNGTLQLAAGTLTASGTVNASNFLLNGGRLAGD
jgi:hypothetical protein